MEKETKAMIVMVLGTFIIGIGSELIVPSSLIVGAVISLIGCAMFLFGAFTALKSMLKNIPEATKEVIKKMKMNKK